MAQRLVVVDDTDPDIQYSGPWFTAQNTQLNTGDFGPPFENTLHGVNSDASFSYSFSGSSITVLGTSITTNASGSQDPTWECFIDNNSIGWNTVLQFAENNWIFCSNNQLQNGPHVLNVKATVSNQQTFWFDQIQYLPSSNVQLDNSMIRFDSSDPAVQYSSGWNPLGGIVNMTQTTGSTITFDFSGVSLSWFGFLPANFPLTTSSATYSVDGQSPTSFLVPNGAHQLYNQVLFQTGQLSAGNHKLIVTYQGNSGTAPLALDSFVVQDAPSPSTTSGGSAPPPSQSSSNTATGASTNLASSTVSIISSHSSIATGVSAGTSISSSVPSSNSNGSSNSTTDMGSTSSSTSTKPPLGAIIGGVLGGFILFLLLLILFMRRRNNRGAQRLGEKSSLNSFSAVVDPFTVTPFHPTPTGQSTSDGPSLIPRSITNKLALQGRKVTSNDVRSTSPTNALSSTSSSPAIPSSSLAVSQTNPIDSKTRGAETVQRSTTSQGDDAGFLRHEDSGIRVAPAQNNFVELPPLYTPG